MSRGTAGKCMFHNIAKVRTDYSCDDRQIPYITRRDSLFYNFFICAPASSRRIENRDSTNQKWGKPLICISISVAFFVSKYFIHLLTIYYHEN